MHIEVEEMDLQIEAGPNARALRSELTWFSTGGHSGWKTEKARG